jgi:hypothetical protein
LRSFPPQFDLFLSWPQLHFWFLLPKKI